MNDAFRTPQEEEQYRAHLAHFDRSAHVMVDGTCYAFSEADLDEVAMGARYYVYFPTGLNSSVYAHIVRMGRSRFRPALTRAQILALSAATLKTPVEAVEQSLDWTAHYMAFHDGGDPDLEHPYPPSEP
ncbi:hypothetical protein BH09MYX1_BH09MYX1_66620 [soil metagenome]